MGAGKVTTQPTTEAEGVKTFTCTVCGKTKTEIIAKFCTIDLIEGVSLNSTYGDTYDFLSDTFDTETEIVNLQFKAKDAEDGTYSGEMPIDAGDYVVRVKTEATDEWKAATAEFEFTIYKKALSFEYELAYGVDFADQYQIAKGVNGEDVKIFIKLNNDPLIDICDRVPVEKNKHCQC